MPFIIVNVICIAVCAFFAGFLTNKFSIVANSFAAIINIAVVVSHILENHP